MKSELVDTGIEVIGTVPWGTHFCQFYQTREDLLDTLLPYFKAGLENNEFCMWITSEPLSAQAARQALRRAMPDFADRLARGQIEILPHTKWYLEGGKFDQQRVLDGWVDKLNAALAAGYTGLRLTGNTFWLEKADWESFTDYEAAVNEVIGKYRMLALCTYSLDKCGAAEIMDVIRNHEFALIRKEGKWEIIENAVYKQSKQAVVDSERKYRQLMESLQEGVWVIDKEACTTFVNPRMAEMLGYRVDEMLGKPLFSFIDESNLGVARERMERRRLGIKEEVEFNFRCKDGSQLSALISAAPLTDASGDFSGVIAGIVDITGRRRMEEELRGSVERYRGLYQSIAGGIVVQDKNGVITEANAAAREILGLTLDEITGRTSANPEWQAVRGDGSPFPVDEHPAMIALRTGESVRGVTMGVFNPAQAGRRWILINAEPVRDERTGQVQAAVTTFMDVTEQRRTEEAAGKARQTLQNTLDSITDGLLVLDHDWRYTYFSEIGAKMLGMRREDLIGGCVWDLFPHASSTKFYEEYHRAAETKQPAHFEEFYPEPLNMWLECHCYPNDEGLAVYFRDVTERKRAEQEIQDLMASVEQEKDRLSSLVNSIPDEVWFADLQKNFTLANPAAAREFGLSTGGAPINVESLATSLEVYRPDGTPRPVEEAPPLRALGGQVVSNQEEIIRTPTRGELRWRRVSAAPVRDANGNIVGSVSIARDVTKLVKAERRIDLLAQAAAELLRSDSPQLVINTLCPKVMAFLDCHAFFNFMVDESAGRLRLNAYAGITEEQAREIEWLDFGVAVCGCAARDACRLVAENIPETPDPRTELVKSYGIRAYACHPLMAQDRVLGTLSFGTRTRNCFTDEELSLMKTVADLVAIAIQRKRTEETLRETRDYLDNLLNYANAPIIVWDPELRVTKFNRAFQKLTGYSESEVLGQHLDLLFPQESREQSLAHIKRALAGERWEVIEIPIQRVDGVVRTVLWNSAHIYSTDGEEPVAIIAQGYDITERKLAEKALRESEEDHRLVFEAAMDGFWVTDLSGRLLQINDSYCQMSGYTRQELLNMHISDIEAVEKPEETSEHIKKVFQQGQDRFETRHRRKDGKLIDIEVSVKYSDAKGGQLIVSARDITERKQADEAVRTLNAAVRQRARLLEAVNKELESFAYSVSHDLRAPLRSIDGFSLALLEDCASKLDDQGKDYLHRVRAASQTMGQLIDDILNLSRVTRAEVHWKRVDLSSVAQKIAQELQDREPKRRVELTIASGLSVHGDTALLRAALQNLLSNAWKFTGKRGVAKIEFGAIKEDGQQVYFVKDNGVGFDMNYAGKLFEPFQRLHSTDEFSGTGVGLATVRRIIDRHGGRVWAEGEVGHGATFYFTLNEHAEEK